MIELPLDPEYLTADGFYMAGYIWGQHVRSEGDARQDFPGDTQGHEDFYKGVVDGYNDKMNEMDARLAKKAPKTQADAAEEDFKRVVAMAGNLHRDAGLSMEEYKQMVENLYSSIMDDEKYRHDLDDNLPF